MRSTSSPTEERAQGEIGSRMRVWCVCVHALETVRFVFIYYKRKDFPAIKIVLSDFVLSLA